MSIVKCALIQASINRDTGAPIEEIREAMLQKHAGFLDQAGAQGVQILATQELFNGPYFCRSHDKRWFGLAEPIPDGPTTRLMQEYAQKHRMVLVSSIFERDGEAYFNTAAVIDADGTYLGKYRKIHIPGPPGKHEKFYFAPSDLGLPVFETAYAKVGVYICFDRHFPEGARILGLRGAEIVFNPSATWVAKSQYLWHIEQPALAVANSYFVGTINRVGLEAPWNIGKFYGSSYFVAPSGQIVAEAGEDNDELLVADLDFAQVQAARELWRWYEERRPEVYTPIGKLQGPSAG
jgi:N-carbamoylputrescine amidase